MKKVDERKSYTVSAICRAMCESIIQGVVMAPSDDSVQMGRIIFVFCFRRAWLSPQTMFVKSQYLYSCFIFVFVKHTQQTCLCLLVVFMFVFVFILAFNITLRHNCK